MRDIKRNAPAATEASQDKHQITKIIAGAQKIGNTGYFPLFGQQLLENGYLIIPIKPGKKRPALDSWPNARLGDEDLHRYPDHGVGVLCGQGDEPIVGIDIDAFNDALAQNFVSWCQENLGITCERVGNKPKVLLVYRAADAGWAKASSMRFEDNPPRYDANGDVIHHRLEILGKGQQFVAYHIHPDTGLPYEWVDLFGGLDAMRASELPVITQTQVEEALLAFEAMAIKAGLVHASGNKTQPGGLRDDDPLMAYEPRLGLSTAQITKALDAMDPDMGHDDWLHIGMGLHHETDGSGFEHWNTWSEKGSKYPGEAALLRRWDSFGCNTGRPVTAATLVKMANENGAAIDLDDPEAFAAAADEGSADNLRFRVVPAGEFSRGQPPGWIIKGVIPRAELVVLFGESGSGKSFLSLDIGAAIARGIQWRGRRTKQGRVIYIAAEGGGGFRNRLAAYQQYHGVKLDGIPFGIIHAAPNFLQKVDAIDVSRAILAGGKADVVIVDTFAQVMPGANENAAEDVGKALAHCKNIHRATGAVVILVHHAGKDTSKGARGWSGLRAAADAEIEVRRAIGGRLLRISKQKDGDDAMEWGFDLEVVPIGVDEDGDVVDSCVVKEADVPTAGAIDTKKRIGPWEKLVLDVMGDIALGQNSGIDVDQVIAEVVRRGPAAEEGKRDTRKQRARRALLTLCDGDDAPFFMEGDCLSVL